MCVSRLHQTLVCSVCALLLMLKCQLQIWISCEIREGSYLHSSSHRKKKFKSFFHIKYIKIVFNFFLDQHIKTIKNYIYIKYLDGKKINFFFKIKTHRIKCLLEHRTEDHLSKKKEKFLQLATSDVARLVCNEYI